MSNPTFEETMQEFDAGIFVNKITTIRVKNNG